MKVVKYYEQDGMKVRVEVHEPFYVHEQSCYKARLTITGGRNLDQEIMGISSKQATELALRVAHLTIGVNLD